MNNFFYKGLYKLYLMSFNIFNIYMFMQKNVYVKCTNNIFIREIFDFFELYLLLQEKYIMTYNIFKNICKHL